MATFTTQDFLKLTYPQLQRLDGGQFEELLDGTPSSDWLKKLKPILTGNRLHYLSQACHEVLLDRLPQAGPTRYRKPGQLRVTTFGYNCMIEGTDERCPYPFNFCVRLDSFQAAITLLIQPNDPEIVKVFLSRQPTLGPNQNFYKVINDLVQCGASRLQNYSVIFLLMFRPGTPTGWQWGTAGGTFSAAEEEKELEAAVGLRIFNETREEFKGYKFWGWTPLIPGQIYQSGNVFEIQYIGASVGYLPPDSETGLAQGEAIAEFKIIPLPQAQKWMQKIDGSLALGSTVVDSYDGKIRHGLAELIPRLKDLGIF